MRQQRITIPTDHTGEIAAPAISVVIAHLNQPGLLHRLLHSIYDQDFAMDTVEVIVVDNGSRELPFAVLADFPGVRIEREAAPGPGHARNRGVAVARAPLIVFTDADCTVARDWLAVIAARFDADPALGILGGDIRLYTAEPGRPTMAEAFECVYAYNQRRYIEREGFSVTANLAVRRGVFEAVGPFAGIAVAEDMDWGQRATRMGQPVAYEPSMVVHHPARRSMAELCAKWDRNTRHHFEVRATGPGGRTKWALSALAMAVSAPAEIPRILATDRVAGARGRAQAFLGLAGIRLYRAWRMVATLAAPATRTPGAGWNR
jgi:GT2 family glycosyltransferase